MTRNKRILSNDRTTKAKKNKVESIEAIRCEKLLQILQDRSSRLTDTSLEGIYNSICSSICSSGSSCSSRSSSESSCRSGAYLDISSILIKQYFI